MSAVITICPVFLYFAGSVPGNWSAFTDSVMPLCGRWCGCQCLLAMCSSREAFALPGQALHPIYVMLKTCVWVSPEYCKLWSVGFLPPVEKTVPYPLRGASESGLYVGCDPNPAYGIWWISLWQILEGFGSSPLIGAREFSFPSLPVHPSKRL